MNWAKADIRGNLTRDMELKYTPAGKALGTFTIAVNEDYQKDGEWIKQDPSYYDITCWGALAESLKAILVKGLEIRIEGRFKQERWEHNGQKRSKISITAKEIFFVNSVKQEVKETFDDFDKEPPF